MTVPFWCLVVAVLVPQALAGLGDYYRKKQFGVIDNHQPRVQYAALTGSGARARAAEQNAWEALPVFAISVFVAHLAGADPGMSGAAAIAFVGCRTLHAVFYVADLSTLRSLIYLCGLACCGWLIYLAAIA